MAKRVNDHDEPAQKRDSRYDEELLSANWNPVVDLLGASSTQTKPGSGDESARNAAQEDPEAFLRRIYNLGN